MMCFFAENFYVLIDVIMDMALPINMFKESKCNIFCTFLDPLKHNQNNLVN